MRQMLCFVLFISSMSFTTGCVTYINIPPQRGDIASHNPNNERLRHATTVALNRILTMYPPAGHYSLELPKGTSNWTYNWIMKRLPQPADDAPIDVDVSPQYQLKQARVRTDRAQLDIIHPSAEGPRLSSVFVEWDPWGWYVKRVRLWRVNINDALILARPPIETPSGDGDGKDFEGKEDPLSATDK